MLKKAKSMSLGEISEKESFELKGVDFSKYMPYGSVKLISEKTGFTKPYVSRVVNGHNYNYQIMEAILEVLNNQPKHLVPEKIASKIN